MPPSVEDQQTTTTTSVYRSQYSVSSKVTILQTLHAELLSTCQPELGMGTEALEIRPQAFLDWAAAERLREMPHDGGRWDQVLKFAESFAIESFQFSEATRFFLEGIDQAESLAFGVILQLLRLGPNRAHILTVVFGVLYEMSLHLGFYARVDGLLTSNEVKNLVAQSYGDVLSYVVKAAVYYTRSGAQGVEGFETRFGNLVSAFFLRKTAAVDLLWGAQLHLISSDIGNSSITIDEIHSFLSPADVTLAATKAGLRSTRRDRSERTCTWFNKHLRDFNISTDKVMHINGKAGSGKTYLAAWIEEKLRANAGVHAYDTITYFINPDFRADLSATTVVKGLLSQAFEFNIGNADLWNAVCDAYMAFERGAPHEEVENHLWTALEVALAGAGKVMVIVDGLDHLAHQPTSAVHLLEHLGKATKAAPYAKSIVLSGPLSKPSPVPVRTFNIDAAHLEEDIYYYIGSSLATTAHFRALSKDDRHSIQHKLSKTSQGSFVWADLALTLLRKQTTLRAVLQEVDSMPKSIHGLIDVHVQALNIASQDTRALLAWLVAAERPLRIPEIKALFEVDATNCTHTPRLTQVEDDIEKALDGLVIQQAGIVRFRHTVVREYITDLASSVKDFKNSGKFPFNIQEAHYDLTVRALAYIKIHLTRFVEPTLEPIDNNYLTELFKDHELLEYTTRYWIGHFMASPMYVETGEHKLTSTIKKVMPETTLLAWIETFVFRFSSSITEALTKQRTAFSVRKQTLGTHSPAALQSLAALATIYQVTLKKTETNEYFYEAWTISQQVLDKHNIFSAVCATRYVDSITTTFTSRTDLAKKKETLLTYIVDTYKVVQGVSSDITVKYLEVLSDYYVQVQDVEKSLTTLSELHNVYIQKYGELDTRTTKMAQRVTQTMEKTSKTGISAEVTKIHNSNFQQAQRTLTASDDRRITITRDMAKMYETQNNTSKAEEMYVDSWRSVTREARSSKDTQVRRKAINSTLDYVRFLRRQKRTEEASSILQGLWTDLDLSSTAATRTDEEMSAVREVGDEMKGMNLYQAAQSVFSSVWGWYKSTGKTNTKEASTVATSYADVAKETNTAQDETILREVLVAASTSRDTHSHTSSLAIVNSLSTTYASQERWSEAINITEDGLRAQWSSLLKHDKTIKLPTENRDTILQTTKQLAKYYLEVSMVEEAEKVHQTLFQAVKNSVDVTSTLFTQTSRDLMTFYEHTYQHEKVFQVWKDVIELHATRLGRTHEATISNMYHLADLYVQQRRTKDAEREYLTIYRAFGDKEDQPLDKPAVKAAEELTRIYEIERRWNDAQKVYFRLQQTILKAKSGTFSADFVNKINQRYLHILKQELRAERSVVRQAASIYRKTCLDVFGQDSEAYISASVQVAQIDEEDEQHRAEAMKIYEEVYLKSRSTSSSWGLSTLNLISSAKHKLAAMFAKSEVHNELSATLYREEFEATRSQRGLGHQETMSWLTYWVTSTAKSANSAEAKARIGAVLQETVHKIFSEEKNSEHLHQSASKLATLYNTAGLKSEGMTIITQMRERAVFSLSDSTQRDRRHYVFIAAFEASLTGGSQSFADIMADLQTEVLYYDTYRADVAKKAHYHATFISGARLLLFLRTKQRTQETVRVEKELREVLVRGLGESAVQNKVAFDQFFTLLIKAVQENEHSVVVIHSGASIIHSYLEASKFEEAIGLTILVERFTRDSTTSAWASNQGVATGFKLSMYLAGHGTKTASNEKLRAQLLDLSRVVLRQTLQAMRSINASLTQFPIRELDQLSIVLGSQQNFEDLEWLLTTLWNARHVQTSWTPSTVVDIGRRLADCRFSRNNVDGAIHIAADIYYNLRRVWGAFDATTLETAGLLSSLHSSAGNHAAAMALHEDVLRMLTDEEADELAPADSAAIATRQLAYLQRAYARLGKWEKPATVYQQLYTHLESTLGKEKAWKDAGVKPLGQWSNKSADEFGLWTPPKQGFSILGESSSSRQHSNHLKRLSRYSLGSSSPASSTASLNQSFHSTTRVNGSTTSVQTITTSS